MTDALLWWVALEVAGLAALPLAFQLLGWLPDRGYCFSKPLGLLLVGYLLWLLVSLGFLNYTRGEAALVLLAFATGNGWLAWRQRDALRDWLRRNVRLMLAAEGLFLVVFSAWCVYRGFGPEIDGTEKPMDMAFTTAILRSQHFPPNDPWMSGFSISYYYFGYLLVATLIKLTGVAPAVGFNLALAGTYALALLASFGLGYGLTRRLGVGLLAACLLGVIGNLHGAYRVWQLKSLFPTEHWWWWQSTRVVPDTINEFPFFSFMLGDLHPHMMALPFTALIVALALNLALSRTPPAFQLSRATLVPGLATAVALGAPGFLNSWDYPTYLFVFCAAAVLRCVAPGQGWRASLAQLAPALSGLVVASFVLYLPFYTSFHSQASGLAAVAQRTPPVLYLSIFGLFVYVAAVFLAAWIWREGKWAEWWPLGLVAAAGVAASMVRGRWLVALLWPLFIAAVGVALDAWQRRVGEPAKRPAEADAAPQPVAAAGQPLARAGFAAMHVEPAAVLSPPLAKPRLLFATLLISTAVLLTMGCEWLFIRDTFNNRMNTVFKLYYQAWALYSVGGAFAIYWLWRRLPGVARRAWAAGLAILLAASCVYPISAGYTRDLRFLQWQGLDGSKFLLRYRPGDYGAIQWLNANAQGDPVILEATGDEYSQAGRFATFTGLPTLLGWAGHELQWRGTYQEQPRRKADIDAIYNGDAATARRLLADYKVRYVLVGSLELERYPPAGLGKFAGFMDKVYSDGGTVIYQVRG